MSERRGLAFISARPRGRRAAWAFRAIVAVQIAVFVIDAVYLVLLGLWVRGWSVPDVAFASYDYGRIGLGYVGVLLPIIAAFFFLVWFQWVYRNLYALGARDLQYSTTWAVGSFFVPISNVVLPYLVAKEIWKASDPEPEAGVPARVPAKLTGWWIAFLAAAVADYAVIKAEEGLGETVGEWVGFILLDMGSALVTIVAAWLTLWLIEEINARQERRHLRATGIAASSMGADRADSGANSA